MDKKQKQMVLCEIDDVEMRLIRTKDTIVDLLDELEIIRNKVEKL